MIYYIIFSYLFLIGAKIENGNLPLWNLLFAPVTFPMLLGQWFANNY